MRFNEHGQIKDRHALLSPSSHRWVNYDEDKLDRVYHTWSAAKRGSELHAFAHQAITLGVRLPDNAKTLNIYVNDAIGYRMSSEVTLYYSDACFGTADTIGFRANVLRIHDLKTGVTKPSMTQLEIYDALFCLEYGHRPFDIKHELRIYQNNDVVVHCPDPDDIFHIMQKIVAFSSRIRELRKEDPL